MTRRMADSVTVTNLPDGFDLYGGYTDGLYANMTALKARFPDKPLVGFTVFASDLYGDCLDVETGDASPTEAPGWIVSRRQQGHPGPLVYCSESIWPQVRAAFQTQNVPEPGYIIAGYPGSAGPAGMYPPPAVGHQWIDRGPYDESVVVDYLPGIDPAPVPIPPIPVPLPEDPDMITSYVTEIAGAAPKQQQHVCFATQDGVVYHWFYDPTDASPGWKVQTLPAHP